jgi:SAM-dependent methyltransferase
MCIARWKSFCREIFLPFCGRLRFNWPMFPLKLQYGPRLDKSCIEEGLRKLLVSGRITDDELARRVARLGERYRVYCACYPYGLWAPGLAVEREMRIVTEAYLPMEEILAVFDRFFRAALKFPPFRPASIIHNSSDWLDILQRLQPLPCRPDPASLLERLMKDEEYRRRFIFANYMPARYGGGFGRYPGQARFLAGWLAANRPRFAEGVRCLDAGCGSGEGTYELAKLLMDNGFAADSIDVRGATVEPLELFAAAHAFFPHDLEREEDFRERISPLFQCGAAERISFHLEDLKCINSATEKGYDIIICNGLLGGPLLHDPEELRRALQRLCGRLSPGGILLAANRFHGGWKKIVCEGMLREILVASGLKTVDVADGVGGVKGEGGFPSPCPLAPVKNVSESHPRRVLRRNPS